jgi:hypothetical protein
MKLWHRATRSWRRVFTPTALPALTPRALPASRPTRKCKHVCSVCQERPSNQMPFKCQHIALCGGASPEIPLTPGCVSAVVREGGGCPICRDKEQHPWVGWGRADGRKGKWRVYLVESEA